MRALNRTGRTASDKSSGAVAQLIKSIDRSDSSFALIMRGKPLRQTQKYKKATQIEAS